MVAERREHEQDKAPQRQSGLSGGVEPAPATAFARLTALTRSLHGVLPPEEILQVIVRATSALVDTPDATVRLVDEEGRHLLVGARVGQPLHQDALWSFRVGDGLVGWIVANCEPLHIADAPSDSRFTDRSDQKRTFHSFLGVPLLIAERRCIGVLSATHESPGWFSAHHLELVVLIAGIAAPCLEMARLKKLVQYDPLTGLRNRRGLDEWLSRRPKGELLSVAAFDIDHFKAVNDTWGHGVGDVALQEVARVLIAFCRSDDAIVRMGGEEFTLFFPGMSAKAAFDRAEAIRLAFERTPRDAEGHLLPLTVSAGVAERIDFEEIDATLERADRALYAAKDAGRNRIVRAGALVLS